ncbi:MAG TPA: alpha/beta hydrolase [Patescibacteria group bacterium]|nr:alpha/beta hydrolase [Patescibacteria group bacterium]
MQSERISVDYRGQKLKLSVKKRVNSEHLVVFLHGIACAKESYDAAFDAVGLNSYSICTLDFLGFGESDKPQDFSYKLEDQATVVKEVVDLFGTEKVSIVGHSVGGAAGLLLARQLPNLVHFINIEGNLVAEDCGLITRSTADQSLDEYKRHGSQNFLHMLTSSERRDFHEWAKWCKQASPSAIHATARSVVQWSDSGKLLGIFNNLENKTYIYGDEEPKDYLLPRFENVSVRYLPGLKHFMMIENPRIFFTAVSEVLNDQL